MGYSEVVCQLCGVSFNIGRIRTKDEPVEAGWTPSALDDDPIDHSKSQCEADGCSTIARSMPEFVHHDGSSSSAHDILEHIAGPLCTSTEGYSGHRISSEEMKFCKHVQCILYKEDDWIAEPEDRDYVVQSSSSFMTGISIYGPDELEVFQLDPVLHGVKECMILNTDDGGDSGFGIPVHPTCMRLYEQLCRGRFHATDIDSLHELWRQYGDWGNRFEFMPQQSPDCSMVNQQFYSCVLGTEYLASNPSEIPSLLAIIEYCQVMPGTAGDVAFQSSTIRKDQGHDPFSSVPPELKLMILFELERSDVAALRQVSRSFQELPQRYFHHLIRSEMPWVWEIEASPPASIDWHKLWCALSAADGGAGEDEKMRKWLYDASWPMDKDLFEGLTKEEKDLHPVLSSGREDGGVSEEQKAAISDVAEKRKTVGKQLPKASQIHGLRNRRRLYNDLSIILDQIAELRGKSKDGTADEEEIA